MDKTAAIWAKEEEEARIAEAIAAKEEEEARIAEAAFAKEEAEAIAAEAEVQRRRLAVGRSGGARGGKAHAFVHRAGDHTVADTKGLGCVLCATLVAPCAHTGRSGGGGGGGGGGRGSAGGGRGRGCRGRGEGYLTAEHLVCGGGGARFPAPPRPRL